MNYILSTFRIILKPAYLSVVISIALIMILIANWLSVHEIIQWVIFSDVFPPLVKLKLMWSWGVMGALQINSTPASRLIVLIIALLSGVNVALIVFYFKRRIKLQRSASVGLVGIIIGFLGVGCSACGSIILSSLFGLSTTIAIIKFLPFKGYEIGFISLVLLVLSIYLTIRKIQDPLVCKVKVKK